MWSTLSKKTYVVMSWKYDLWICFHMVMVKIQKLGNFTLFRGPLCVLIRLKSLKSGQIRETKIKQFFARNKKSEHNRKRRKSPNRPLLSSDNGPLPQIFAKFGFFCSKNLDSSMQDSSKSIDTKNGHTRSSKFLP